jgi:hypothetical protein
MRTNELCLALGFLAMLVLATGCDPTTPAPVAQNNPAAATSTDDHDHPHGEGHAHGAGPHDGTVADWGGGKFHVEFTVNHDTKETTVYVLGGDEKTAAPVKTPDGKLLLTIKEPAFQVDLVASPMEGEVDGMSSRYVGKHDNLGIVQEFSGTISGEADGTPYSGDFKEEPHDHE